MKKVITMVAVCMLIAGNAVHAGCGEWGKVNYVYSSISDNSGQLLAIIKGTACSVLASADAISNATGVLAEARASGLDAYIVSSGGTVSVAIQYNP